MSKLIKFNVGDVVVAESKLKSLSSLYNSKGSRTNLLDTVTESDKIFFTTQTDNGRHDSVLTNAFSCGMNEYMANTQKSGHNMTGTERFLHLEKDKDEISQIIKKQFGEVETKLKDKRVEKVGAARCSYKEDMEIVNSNKKAAYEIFNID